MACREKIAPHPGPRDADKRTVFGEFGCTVYGWPSSGGVVIRLNADLVELKQLGFDPLNPATARYADIEKEDTFCKELRMIGGKWWPSEKRFIDVWFGSWDESGPSEKELRLVWFGWLENGGLLLLEGENMEAPEDIGRLRMATTMEERCAVMRKRFEVVVFEDPKMYDGLKDVYG